MTDPLDDALEPLVVGAVAVTARALAAAGLDLTFVQWRVLLIVGESEHGVSVTDLAERIGSQLSPTSRLVSRLQRRGMVETHKDEHDRRTTRVSLTDAGRAARTAVLRRRARDLAAVRAEAALSDTDEQAVARLATAFAAHA